MCGCIISLGYRPLGTSSWSCLWTLKCWALPDIVLPLTYGVLGIQGVYIAKIEVVTTLSVYTYQLKHDQFTALYFSKCVDSLDWLPLNTLETPT